MATAKLINSFEEMVKTPLLQKCKDQQIIEAKEGEQTIDPTLFLYESRVCTFCEEHCAEYFKTPADRRVSTLKTRPLKNPFIMCSRIKSLKSMKQRDEEEDYMEQ